MVVTHCNNSTTQCNNCTMLLNFHNECSTIRVKPHIIRNNAMNEWMECFVVVKVCEIHSFKSHNLWRFNCCPDSL